ncbi:MAG: alanine--tRNA ligase, partial [Ruminococcaceae bacterium]|nr:alanine--tRNA ligase [Oscillospiraceae bacterium]
TGTLGWDGLLINVSDTQKSDGVYIHICSMVNGEVKVGDPVHAMVNVARRESIKRNHSGCHLLQAALRKVLGTHVEQAGSYVDDHHLRFDFSHFAAMTAEEIRAVETLVNSNILVGNAVITEVMNIEDAKKKGAMMLFGEKYGDVVRVVEMGNSSMEFCGGTHVSNTAQIGLFKITAETSVAAGVRRIEAVTGKGVLELMAQKDKLIADTAKELKVQNSSEIAKRAAALQCELVGAKHEIEHLNAKIASGVTKDILSNSAEVGACKLVTAYMENLKLDVARGAVDELKAQYGNIVVVLAIAPEGKLNFITAAGKDAVAAGIHAGKLAGAVAAVTGGKGGGRPDSAMAGGQDRTKVDEALATAKATVEGMLK